MEEPSWAASGDDFGQYAVEATLLGYSGITLASVLWKSYFCLVTDHFGERAVEKLLWATQGSLWPVCCERATLGYSGSLWPACCERATLGYSGSLSPARCGRAKLGYSGITLASVLWKG